MNTLFLKHTVYILISLLVLVSCSDSSKSSCDLNFELYQDYLKEFKLEVPSGYVKRQDFKPEETVYFIYPENSCLSSVSVTTFRGEVLVFEEEVLMLKKQLPINGYNYTEEKFDLDCNEIDSIFVVSENVKFEDEEFVDYLIFIKSQNHNDSYSLYISTFSKMNVIKRSELIKKILCSFTWI
jgi:hypothetical protein